MATFYPDVRTEDGIQAGANWGAMAAIGFGFLALLTAIPSFFMVVRLTGYGAGVTQFHYAILFAIIFAEAAFCFFAGYRFMQRKGLVTGILLALLMAWEVSAKLLWLVAIGPLALLSPLLLLSPFLFYGLFNGLRAARAARRVGPVADGDLGSVFE